MYLCLRQRAIETGWWLYVESSFNTQIEAEYGSQKVFNRNLENCAIPQTSRKHRKFKNFFQSYEKKCARRSVMNSNVMAERLAFFVVIWSCKLS